MSLWSGSICPIQGLKSWCLKLLWYKLIARFGGACGHTNYCKSSTDLAVQQRIKVTINASISYEGSLLGLDTCSLPFTTPPSSCLQKYLIALGHPFVPGLMTLDSKVIPGSGYTACKKVKPEAAGSSSPGHVNTDLKATTTISVWHQVSWLLTGQLSQHLPH